MIPRNSSSLKTLCPDLRIDRKGITQNIISFLENQVYEDVTLGQKIISLKSLDRMDKERKKNNFLRDLDVG
jgi:hypothetical protein